MEIQCVNCKEIKSAEEFYTNKNCSTGRDTTCKECFKKRANERYLLKREEILKQTAERQKGSDKYKQYQKEYQSKNRSKLTHLSKLSRHRRNQATPQWLTDADKFQIEMLYKLREILSTVLGEKHHVDHIVPIGGKNVCGLHVPWNLRIIPETTNLEKSNKLLDEFSTFYYDKDSCGVLDDVSYCWDDL